MYNRYVPQADGSYRRDRIIDTQPIPPALHHPEEKKEPIAPPPPTKQQPHRQQSSQAGDFLRQLLPKNLDTGDLIVILLLLLMAGDCQEDRNTALLTLAIYLFM